MASELRRMRKEKKLSEVANEIGMSVQYLSKLEIGCRTPSLKMAYKLSRYYNVSVEELFPDLISK